MSSQVCCYQSCKDKNFKAIHNMPFCPSVKLAVVINLAKIKILKQFTTSSSCICSSVRVVINLAKIKILKQFTTNIDATHIIACCYQSCKDKNFKAIHNGKRYRR